MSWVPGFTPPPPKGGPPGWAPPESGICMPSMHMHTYAFICMSICICISTSTYACIAYACKHIRAWHACTYIFFMFSECRQLVTLLVRNQWLDSPNTFHSKTLNETTISHKTVTIKAIRTSPNEMIQSVTVFLKVK